MRRLAIIVAITFIGVTAFYMTGFGSTQNVYDERAFDEVVYLHASVKFFETTLEGLESRANHIVRARVMDDATTVFVPPASPSPLNIPPTGHTLVSIEILEVIKGDTKVGDTIRIVEPYFIRDNTLFTFTNYMPSIPYEEYFFFLSNPLVDRELFQEEFIGAFPNMHGERGRYRVPSMRAVMQSYSAADLSLGTGANSDLYMRLWQEVIDAFMN